MQDTLSQSLQSDPWQATLTLVLCFVGYILLGLLPASGAVYLLYFLLTLPMRRNERARMVLDGMELGLGQGQTPEAAIVAIAGSRDRSFGARFFLLSERLRAGKRLAQALGEVPRLLPPQIVSMLQAGERIGDVGKVLPACRQVLRDGISQVRGALNYVILVVFVASPALVLIPIFFNLKVLPKYEQMFADLFAGPLPGLTRLTLSGHTFFTGIQLATILFLWLVLLAYLGGPRLQRWINRIAPGLPDRLALWLPWRHKRAQRDFSTFLALLLDTGVPESEAVALAAQATGNRLIVRRAGAVTDALSKGVMLPEALNALDDAAELRWRIANAKHGRGGFTRALAGWHDALDAKAFQLEQTAAQVTTTALVLINGVVVGLFVIGVFISLIRIMGGAPLW